jgi:hypothetical protein
MTPPPPSPSEWKNGELRPKPWPEELPEWLCDKVRGVTQPNVNEVFLRNLHRAGPPDLVGETWICHIYDITTHDLKNLIEGCKDRGAWLTIIACSPPDEAGCVTTTFKIERIEKKENSRDISPQIKGGEKEGQS